MAEMMHLPAPPGGTSPGGVVLPTAEETAKVTWPKLNLSNPAQFTQAVTNVVNLYESASKATRQEGLDWYPKAHDDVAAAIRGHSIGMEQAAGMAAAFSPKADWARQNFPAFKEALTLKSSDWDLVEEAAKTGKRTPELSARLSGMRLNNVPTGMLERARRFRTGESLDVVIPRATSTKINSFGHNIWHPDVAGPVTVDFRAHDIAANTMIPVEYSGRGIVKNNSRYRHLEDVYRASAGMVGAQFGHFAQAVTWVRGKQRETQAITKTGTSREKGEARVGQAYV